MEKALKISFIGWSICLACIAGRAQQNYFQIRGTVIDADARSPMPGATVYLSNTTIGTTASGTGAFILDHIPPGSYKLIVSFLGYKTRSVAVSRQDSGKTISLELQRDAGKLKGVTVRARRRRDKNRKNYFELFKKCFIGTDDNAADCRVMNPDVLYYGYDERAGTFTAAAAEPLVIINEALGYKIYYDLQSFTYHFGDHHIVYFGYPRFEPLTAADPRRRADWENNRGITYQQSRRYFMLMLKERRLSDKGFEVNKLIRVDKDSLPPLPVYSTREIGKMLHGNAPIPVIEEPEDTLYPDQEPYDSMIGNETDSNYVRLKFTHSLRILIPSPRMGNKAKSGLTVVRFNEGGHRQPGSTDNTGHSASVSGPSISIITMARPETYIDPNGALTDPLAVSVEGAWARMQVADLLPFDYRLNE